MNWLFLRGLTREQRHWGAFRTTFEHENDKCRTFGIDLPGTGTEILRDSPFSVARITDDIRTRWLELKAASGDEPWGLLGLSLGGMVAMDWAARYPQDFKGVVLVNTSAGNTSWPFRRMNLTIVPRLVRAGLQRDPFARERAIVDLTTSLSKDPDALAGEWAAIAGDSWRLKLAFVRQLTAAFTYEAPKTIPIPALFLTSARDVFTDPSCSLKLARRFHSALRMHPSAGHDLPVDDPLWVAQEVHHWAQKRLNK